MDERQSVMLASVCAVSAILFLAYKRGVATSAGNVDDVYQSDQGDATLYPDYGAGNNPTTPGFINEPWYMNGANQAIPTTGGENGDSLDITINPWSTLSQQYMPLFGFVGVSTGAYQ